MSAQALDQSPWNGPSVNQSMSMFGQKFRLGGAVNIICD